LLVVTGGGRRGVDEGLAPAASRSCAATWSASDGSPFVFDRGGWSPKLFDTMIKGGFDLLTYRKGRCRRIK